MSLLCKNKYLPSWNHLCMVDSVYDKFSFLKCIVYQLGVSHGPSTPCFNTVSDTLDLISAKPIVFLSPFWFSNLQTQKSWWLHIQWEYANRHFYSQWTHILTIFVLNRQINHKWRIILFFQRLTKFWVQMKIKI